MMLFTVCNWVFYRQACAITDSDTVVITGGWNDTPKKVSRYSVQGWQEDLPALITGRMNHACTSYMSRGRRVRKYEHNVGYSIFSSDRSSRRGNLVGACIWDIMLKRAQKEFLQHSEEARGVLGALLYSKQARKHASLQAHKQASIKAGMQASVQVGAMPCRG